MNNLFLHNGEILPISEAVIPLSNIEYSYGFGVYENVRVSNGVIFFLKDHIERLLRSAKIINLEHDFSQSFIEDGIRDLVSKTKLPTYNIKILLIGASTKSGASLFALCLNPFFPDKKFYRDGASFITYKHERVFPHAKTLNMLQSYMAYSKAKKTETYDALLINNKGFITEGTRTNFFCINDRTIYSPPEESILLGITRKVLLKVAQTNGFDIVQKEISPNDVKSYQGAFVSSTSSKIIPIKTIDDQIEMPQSEDLKKLMVLFDDFLTKCGGKI